MMLKLQEERQRSDFLAGVNDGRTWTIYRADRPSLEALELVDAVGIDEECPGETDRQKVFAAYFVDYYGEEGGNHLDVAGLMASVFPLGSSHGAEYVNGFQLGAMMAWNAIKPLLKAGAGSEGAGAA